MGDMHLTRDLLRAIASGEIDPHHATAIAGQHVLCRCPECSQNAAMVKDSDRVGTDPSEAERVRSRHYERVFERVVEATHISTVEFGREEDAARRDLVGLLAISPEQRAQRVAESEDRFHSPLLADLLLERSRLHFQSDSLTALELADLALLVLSRDLPSGAPRSYSVGLIALALAYRANALRIEGNLAEADRSLAEARLTLRDGRVDDTLLLAEIDDLEGSLRRAQRRFPVAERLLTQAISRYRSVGASHEAARTQILLGLVFEQANSPRKGLEVLVPGLAQIDADAFPRLALAGQHNVALCLCALERYQEARKVLNEALPLYSRYQDLPTQQRLRWLQARLARGLGEFSMAETLLLEIIYQYQQAGVTFDAALASLELAELYLEQGRTAEVQRLALELAAHFERQQVPEEADKALRAFFRAATSEAVTLGLIKKTLSALERSGRWTS